MQTRLILIRHAEAEGNPEGRMLGCVETELTPYGFHQARLLQQQLQDQALQPACLYTSPQKRALQTAQWVAPAVPSQICPELRELDQGIFTGLTWAEASQRYPELCARLEQNVDWLPIEGAETPQSARKRAEQFVQKILQVPLPSPVLIVTHGGLLSHLLSALLGSTRTWGFNVATTARFDLTLDWERWLNAEATSRFNSTLWRIERFNDTSHLKLTLAKA
ncbi:histidine phosphatase family protein [Leptolyngbya sp. FACHB-261]|uniref:histidine phosphatase family protein n=1 Tax=Leptolyngbya sp. FACHB-261 TaxID=2692806 RepID=UPI0016854CC7|nr:histidine phosphatase family protein [Leptolyngbya sp. FACHB-261]MBD2103537.1 histidine phosphatase family protein [Leptolyngbya sp. FACHB-261]